MSKNILIPLPNKDFDTTEVAVPWKLWKQQGFTITFATENGEIPACDPLLLRGVIFGQLGAKKEAISFYNEMIQSPEFLKPIKYADIDVNAFDLIHLPGGHAQGMRQYLESTVLQNKVLSFFKKGKMVGSICHGAIVLARTIDNETGKSVIYQRKLTGLIKILERIAYYITFWKLGKYYRTYDEYVQDEVKSVLIDRDNFKIGNPLKPFVCVDDNLITARYPEDAYLYAQTIIEKLSYI